MRIPRLTCGARLHGRFINFIVHTSKIDLACSFLERLSVKQTGLDWYGPVQGKSLKKCLKIIISLEAVGNRMHLGTLG